MRPRTKETETIRLSPTRSSAPKPDRPTDRPKLWAESRITQTRSGIIRTNRNTHSFKHGTTKLRIYEATGAKRSRV